MGHKAPTDARRWTWAIALGATLVLAATGSTVATLDQSVAENSMSDAVREWRGALQAADQSVAENSMSDAVREWRRALQAADQSVAENSMSDAVREWRGEQLALEVSRGGDDLLPLPQQHP